MLIVLPPSETKAEGGTGAPLDLGNLSFPELTGQRRQLVDDLVALARDPAHAATVLALGARQLDVVTRNADLWTSPTTPAVRRYTGVLFDALDAAGMTPAMREKARRRIAIGSALFGLVRASDPIPAYRLSGGTKLPGRGTLAAHWKPAMDTVVATLDQGVVVDLRSGTYQNLGVIPGAITTTVLTEKPDGSRSVVSHFAKHHRGLLAHALVRTRAEPSDIRGVAKVARSAGLHVEVSSPTELTVLTH